jgi:hypothetical protein
LAKLGVAGAPNVRRNSREKWAWSANPAAWEAVFRLLPPTTSLIAARTRHHARYRRLAVSGFHMPFPSIGYVERRRDGGYRWLPHSYQLDI